MIVTRHGEGYFRLQSGKTTVLIDPTDNRSMKGAAVALFTEEGDGNTGGEGDGAFVIRHAGEYGVSGIHIEGWQADPANARALYTVTCDGVTFGVFGDMRREPGAELLEHLQNIDVAFAPSRRETIHDVAHFLRQIEPSIVIPTHGDESVLVKEFGGEVKKEEKLVFKKGDLEEGAMKVVCLK